MAKTQLMVLAVLLGLVGSAPLGVAQPRIVGGIQAGATDYPWMVALVSRGNSNNRAAFLCGGVLIHPQAVLTAAHCVRPFGFGPFHERSLLEPGALQVVVGAHDLEQSPPRIDVDSIVARTDFIDMPDTSLRNDLAVVKLRTPVTSPWLGLADSAGSSAPGTMATAMGWGRTDPSSSSSVTVLREVTMPTVSFGEAAASLSGIYTLVDGQLGAGLPEGGKDSCTGDSGGPLVVNAGNGRQELIGLVSFGSGCAEPDRPGMYTDVFFYRRWILDQIAPDISDWERRHQLTGWWGDVDGDGRHNLLEYAHGTSPRNRSDQFADRGDLLEVDGSPYLTFSSRRWDAPDIALRCAASTDLEGGSWTWFPLAGNVVSSAPAGPTFETFTFRSPLPATISSRQFLRMEVNLASRLSSRIQSPGLVSGALTVNDGLDEGRQFDEHRFRVPRAQAVQIDMTSFLFDPSLVLLDEAGQPLAADDNNGPGNAALLLLNAEADEEYVIRVTSAGQGDTGAYQLRVTPVP